MSPRKVDDVFANTSPSGVGVKSKWSKVGATWVGVGVRARRQRDQVPVLPAGASLPHFQVKETLHTRDWTSFKLSWTSGMFDEAPVTYVVRVLFGTATTLHTPRWH